MEDELGREGLFRLPPLFIPDTLTVPLLIEQPKSSYSLKPCVSNTGGLRERKAEREEERAIDKTEVRQNTRPDLSPIFPEYVCRRLLFKPPLASMNNEKEQ